MSQDPTPTRCHFDRREGFGDFIGKDGTAKCGPVSEEESRCFGCGKLVCENHSGDDLMGRHDPMQHCDVEEADDD